ncbi:hypothetical protein [Lysobacter terrae]
MILNSMLSNSPVFLFLMSGLLLALYAIARLIQACIGLMRNWLSHPRSAQGPLVR